MTKVHYTYEDLQEIPAGLEWRRMTIRLDDGETAWNPASTKHVIHGPCLVTYEQSPEGGVNASVEEFE